MPVARIVTTRFLVEGVHADDDTKAALQALYDIFAQHGLGQATFEIIPGEHTRLWVKHRDDVQPTPELIDEALARAGEYRVVDG
ncbi:hypothetical protein [Janibacter anophelis]|uniref:hypothetical protein n=1 Tax=Janibacter anophelis TaxID=319054 RepID=UPI000A6EF0F2|nr:hypothetical protein [Janibacter anophelis]